MRDRLLVTTGYVLGTALVLFLPWSIPVWAIAGTYHVLNGRSEGAPDTGLYVLAAPAFPAVLLVYGVARTLDRILPR